MKLKVAIASISYVFVIISHIWLIPEGCTATIAPANKHIVYYNKQISWWYFGIWEWEEGFIGLVLHITQVLKIKHCNV